MGKQKEAGAAGETITQKDAVAAALAAGKEKPEEGVAYVKEKFGITLKNNGAFSTLKSQLRKAGATPAKRGRKPGRPAATKAPAAPSTNGVPNMARQIEALKVLCDSLGVDQVVSIAQLFRK